MSSNVGQSVVAIVASNSCDFVSHAFKCLNGEQAFAALTNSIGSDLLKSLHVDKSIDTKRDFGWYSGPRYQPQAKEAIAQISFSSGTEGNPKAIQISHRSLANTCNRLIDIMELDSTIREYIGIPVYHSFGFGRCRAVSASGGEFYIPENGFSPLEILDLLQEDKINAISAVPSLWRVLLDSAHLFEAFAHKIRWIEIGSQFMSADEKVKLKKLFSNAVIVQHYGLTEASRTSFLRVDNCPLEHLESVGRALYDVKIDIDPNGLIRIKGPHLSTAVLTELHRVELADSEGWFTTNDLGHVNNGYLYFDGRKDDVINCAGIKIGPDFIELELKKRLSIKDGIAVFGVVDEVRGEVPVLAIEASLHDRSKEFQTIFATLLAETKVNIGKRPDVYLLEQLPKTATGKIKRKEIAVSYNSQLKSSSPTKPKDQEPVHDEMTTKIINIWKQILNIDNVNSKDSFFDLGGDSLSAIRVSVAMEKSGVPRSLSRKIFQGFSIEQIVGEFKPSQQGTEREKLTQDIIGIWESILGVTAIGATDSFFDLGGDSLSAIRVSIAMEKAGIPRDVSRKVFQGLAIEKIVEKTIEHKSSGVESRQVKTPLATGSQAINVIRGLLVILNVAAHWMPGVVARVHPFFAEINKYLAPLYSSGTPGFAVVFGAGIGYFIYPRFQKSPSSITSLAFRNAGILALGLLCLASVRIGATLAESGSISALHASNTFYSVLTYYLFACLSLPIWLRILAVGRFGFFANAMLMSVFSYALHLIISAIEIPPSEKFYIQPFVLMLTAKYSYFEMSCGVFLGAAFGHLIRTDIEAGRSLSRYVLVGILFVVLSVFISIDAGNAALWFVWPKETFLWTWIFYCGIAIIGIVVMYRFLQEFSQGVKGEFTLNTLAIIGVLAFPLFIAHEIVMPLKELLANLGVPFALPISMGLYFSVSAYVIFNLYRMYYGKSNIEVDEI